MGSVYKINKRFDYIDMASETSDTGRIYHTPYGPLPSVTTILSTLPHPGLDAWRERVGEEEANRVSKEATDIGSCMHDLLENHTLGNPMKEPSNDLEKMAFSMFKCVKTFGLTGLDEIWGVEEALYCHDLYAGRTDLIGLYNKKPSVIDYKTSIRQKIDEYLENYKMQIGAYTIAHEEMFPEQKFEQGVILIGIRPNRKYKKGPRLQRIIMDEDELNEYKIKWLDVVSNYYSSLDR